MITKNLIRAIRLKYALEPHGIHGVAHWARVLENGLRVAESSGARVEVVELFSVFHDSRRFSNASDPGHGLRGAEYAAELRGVLFDLPDSDFELLYEACAYHTDGLTAGDVTVQTCWDADRLDLSRVGITPRPSRLCTDAAKDPRVIEWADRRAWTETVPELVERDWGVKLPGQKA
jgi:uncharacterized protein